MHIGAVERETGLSRDVLRVWERRYGFPMPKRDARGDRVYTLGQVERLRLIKRLMDGGHRAGSVVGRPESGLVAMLSEGNACEDGAAKAADPYLSLVSEGRIEALRTLLRRCRRELALPDLLGDVMAPLTTAVGQAWQSGRLPIHKEHVYTEEAQDFLRELIASSPPALGRPRVLLTTLPGEQHGLALLMISALCRAAGVQTVLLGTQTPVQEIVEAARCHACDVVAVSFSLAYPRRSIRQDIRNLRGSLPSGVQLWVGGGGAARLPTAIPSTCFGSSLHDVATLLERWTAER